MVGTEREIHRQISACKVRSGRLSALLTVAVVRVQPRYLATPRKIQAAWNDDVPLPSAQPPARLIGPQWSGLRDALPWPTPTARWWWWWGALLTGRHPRVSGLLLAR